MVRMRNVLLDVPARDVMISEFRALPPDASVRDAADELDVLVPRHVAQRRRDQLEVALIVEQRAKANKS